MQVIKFISNLSEEEVFKVAEERKPQFEALPGLVQKYYIKNEQTGQFGGVYIWYSMESLQAYRESDLAASIPKAYQFSEPPEIEILEIVYPLR